MVAGAAAALVLLVSTGPPGREVSGVRVPETVPAGEETLRLNGVGVRKVFIFKVYLTALYLEERCTDPELIIASDQAKAVRLVFLMNVDHQDVMEEFELGLRNNSEEHLAELRPQLDRIRAIIPDMKKGQMLSFLYQPRIGTIVAVQGGKAIVLEGKSFADALLRSVIGKKPYDRGQREDLLRGH